MSFQQRSTVLHRDTVSLSPHAAQRALSQNTETKEYLGVPGANSLRNTSQTHSV